MLDDQYIKAFSIIVALAAPATVLSAVVEGSEQHIIEGVVQQWLAALRGKDIAVYQRLYVPALVTQDWLKVKNNTLFNAKKIKIEISEPDIVWVTNDKATISFSQSIQFEATEEVLKKILTMEKIDGSWKISGEIDTPINTRKSTSSFTEFNLDVLDVVDKKNIDLSVFSRAGYVAPGRYILAIKVNKHAIQEQAIMFYAGKTEQEGAEACISPEVVSKLGLKEGAVQNVSYWHDGECADFKQLPGISIRNAINDGYIALSIPQAWMEYSDPDWVPSALWDNGLTSFILDYNINASTMKYRNVDSHEQLSAYGTTGVNFGPWRLRADFQGQHSSENSASDDFKWSRFYAYRALPEINSTLMVGENYLGSDLFDSFRFKGIALNSDDRMLPPALRGYAPEVRGIAKTNAKVTVSQNGYIVYETTVAAGPFNIQELGSGLKGKLDVKVEEQDGRIQAFQVDTATIPYLTRPGQLRYKVAAGKPSSYGHVVDGPLFGSGEFSWGGGNSWSLFGGAILADQYKAVALGLGRDLYQLGALSFDVTRSAADLADNKYAQGFSYRLNYAKRFDEMNSEITFAAYRFSQRDFMSMDEFIGINRNGGVFRKNKEMYTVTANKNFSDYRASMYASYNHQSYWNNDVVERASIMLSKNFDFGELKNVAINFSFDRRVDLESDGNSMTLSLSIPFGQRSSLSYNHSRYDGKNNQTVNYTGSHERDSWQVSAGVRDKESGSAETVRGYYTHEGDLAVSSLNLGHESGAYWSLGAMVRGGLTLSTEGAALHQQGLSGGTRLMIDTDGIAGVPVNYGKVRSNLWGKAVVGDINSYYRSRTEVDVNKLDDDVEAIHAAVDATLTEGAVGYRKFSLQKGLKAMTVLSLPDGSRAPLGAQVLDINGRSAGLVSDGGVVYLSGIKPGGVFTVLWSDKKCRVNIAEELNKADLSSLTCVPY